MGCSYLGEERCPYGFDFLDVCGFDDGVELIGLQSVCA